MHIHIHLAIDAIYLLRRGEQTGKSRMAGINRHFRRTLDMGNERTGVFQSNSNSQSCGLMPACACASGESSEWVVIAGQSATVLV